MGYHPEVILAGRRINDRMAEYVADETVKLMLKKGLPVLGCKILVLGLSFKENCPDVRNSKVVDIVNRLQTYNTNVDIYDPWVDLEEAKIEYGIDCLPSIPENNKYSAIVLAVSHDEFKRLGVEKIKQFGVMNSVIFDVKGVLEKNSVDGRL